MSVKSLIFSLLTLCACSFCALAGDLRDDIAFFAGEQAEGRGCGTLGNQRAAFYIINTFRSFGLLDLTGSMTGSFVVKNKNLVGHNIVGMLDTNPDNHPDRYIVVGAHFDGLGVLKGQTYPCADANASGTAALLKLAKNYSRLIECGRRLNYNIIFVAFDGFHEDLSGAEHFLNCLKEGLFTDPVSSRTIRPSDIKLMVDLCQLGGCEPPVVKEREDYLIILGEYTLPDDKRGLFHSANCMSGNHLDLFTNFYGSAKFTEAFYKMGDRKIFIREGIPTLLFTSGITDLTYSKNDTAQSLDYPNLEKRCLFIYNFLFLYLCGS